MNQPSTLCSGEPQQSQEVTVPTAEGKGSGGSGLSLGFVPEPFQKHAFEKNHSDEQRALGGMLA